MSFPPSDAERYPDPQWLSKLPRRPRYLSAECRFPCKAPLSSNTNSRSPAAAAVQSGSGPPGSTGHFLAGGRRAISTSPYPSPSYGEVPKSVEKRGSSYPKIWIGNLMPLSKAMPIPVRHRRRGISRQSAAFHAEQQSVLVAPVVPASSGSTGWNGETPTFAGAS
jgi:hypothetical protein